MELTKLILDNQNLIYKIANYFEGYANKDDLFQVGCIGMILAYKNYDDSLNVKFTTYAYPYILGEMKKYIREDKGIKISRDISKLGLKIEKASIILAQKLFRNPSTRELAEYLEIPEELIVESLRTRNVLQSIDETINDGEKELTLHDTVGYIDNANLDELITLKEHLTQLTPFEQKLIQTRYINDYTQQETANVLGISQVQVSRKEQKVLMKLKDKMVA